MDVIEKLQKDLEALSRQRDSGVRKSEVVDAEIKDVDSSPSYGVADRYWISFPKDYNGKTQVSVYDEEVGEGVGELDMALRLMKDRVLPEQQRRRSNPMGTIRRGGF